MARDQRPPMRRDVIDRPANLERDLLHERFGAPRLVLICGNCGGTLIRNAFGWPVHVMESDRVKCPLASITVGEIA